MYIHEGTEKDRSPKDPVRDLTGDGQVPILAGDSLPPSTISWGTRRSWNLLGLVPRRDTCTKLGPYPRYDSVSDPCVCTRDGCALTHPKGSSGVFGPTVGSHTALSVETSGSISSGDGRSTSHMYTCEALVEEVGGRDTTTPPDPHPDPTPYVSTHKSKGPGGLIKGS